MIVIEIKNFKIINNLLYTYNIKNKGLKSEWKT